MSPAVLGTFSIPHSNAATSFSGWWISQANEVCWAHSWDDSWICAESWGVEPPSWASE